MTDDTYQGWVNRETWAVALHLNNDESLYNIARALAKRDDYGEGIQEFVEGWVYDLINDHSPDAYNIVTDLGSLWRVDWEAVRAAFVDET